MNKRPVYRTGVVETARLRLILCCTLSMTKMSGFRIVFALVLLILGNSATKPSKNREVFQAKSLIDSLLLKLHLNLKTLKTKEQAAAKTEKEAREEISVLHLEQVQATRIQRLLHRLATGRMSALTPICQWHGLATVEFADMQAIQIRSKSAIPQGYTVSVDVNHQSLIDKGLAQPSGNDLRVYYRQTRHAEPVQLDRIVSGLSTSRASILFSIQAPISANSTNDFSYHLVFGSKTAGPAMHNPKKVYAFYDDFTDGNLGNRWRKNWGEWTVKNGRLLGKTDQTPSRDSGEIGIYVTKGMNWKDVVVELDMMETQSSKEQYPGAFLRVLDPRISHTTAWWFEYYKGRTVCTMRPFNQNRDGIWKYRANLPSPLTLNTWFHFKYQVSGNKFSQWANNQLIQNNVKVEKAWMVPKGTLGLGCHNQVPGCRTYWDNIKVRLLVTNPPQVSLGRRCTISHNTSYLLGGRKLPANSCKQIHDASLLNGKPRLKNGLYWIRTKRNDLSTAVRTYCDMENGGWTLVGKVSGSVGNIFNTWLVKNKNLNLLRSGPLIESSNKMSCMDARLLAVAYASEVMLASGDNSKGIGRKWVRWALPERRELKSFWNHAVGYSKVNAAGKDPVNIVTWNGKKQMCFQNKFGIMPLWQHGGSYPYASFNTRGNTAVNDYCMGMGVMVKGFRVHGWYQDANGYDSAKNNADWPNASYNHQAPYVTVWLK